MDPTLKIHNKSCWVVDIANTLELHFLPRFMQFYQKQPSKPHNIHIQILQLQHGHTLPEEQSVPSSLDPLASPHERASST